MRICISCQKDVQGKKSYPVQWDRFLKLILAVKKALRIAQGNELFVCEDCLAKHQERRRSFERSMVLAGVLAGIIFLLLISTFVLKGTFDAWAFFAGIVLSLVVLLFPLFRYVPALVGMPVRPFGKPQAAKNPEPEKAGQAKQGAAKEKAAPQKEAGQKKPQKRYKTTKKTEVL
jgi:hypothetical protein